MNSGEQLSGKLCWIFWSSVPVFVSYFKLLQLIMKKIIITPHLFQHYSPQRMNIDEGRIPTTTLKKLDSPNLAITLTAFLTCNDSYYPNIWPFCLNKPNVSTFLVNLTQTKHFDVWVAGSLCQRNKQIMIGLPTQKWWSCEKVMR